MFYCKSIWLICFCCCAYIYLQGCTGSNVKSSGTLSTTIKTSQLNLTPPIGETNKITFLTFDVLRTDSVLDTYVFNKSNVLYAEGVVKKQSQQDEELYEQTYLYCEILDENKKRIDLIKVLNPLIRVFEYSNEKTNALEKKMITSSQGSFVIRFNFNRHTKYLVVYKASSFQTLKKIYDAQL